MGILMIILVCSDADVYGANSTVEGIVGMHTMYSYHDLINEWDKHKLPRLDSRSGGTTLVCHHLHQLITLILQEKCEVMPNYINMIDAKYLSNKINNGEWGINNTSMWNNVSNDTTHADDEDEGTYFIGVNDCFGGENEISNRRFTDIGCRFRNK